MCDRHDDSCRECLKLNQEDTMVEKPIPKYCRHCGKRLFIEDIITGYDEQTGAPNIVGAQRVCRNSYCPSKHPVVYPKLK